MREYTHKEKYPFCDNIHTWHVSNMLVKSTFARVDCAPPVFKKYS